MRINGLNNLSDDELVTALNGIPRNVTTLNLGLNDFEQRQNTDHLFAAISPGVKVIFGTEPLQNKWNAYHINVLLSTYLDQRKRVINSAGVTKDYFYGSFFSYFQKSFRQKEAAVNALKAAINGEQVDLSEHLSTLRNGHLGNDMAIRSKNHECCLGVPT